MQAWINDLKTIVYYFKANYKVPYKETVFTRKSSIALSPLLCGLCCCWSVLWRILCCPLSCASEQGIYSQNILTQKSDNVIKTYFDKNNERIVLCTMPSIKDATVNELNELIIILTDLIKIYKVPTYTKEYYILTDSIVKSFCKITDICIPEFAKKIIYNNLLRIRLEVSSRSLIKRRKSFDIIYDSKIDIDSIRRKSALDPPEKILSQRRNTISDFNNLFDNITISPKRANTFVENDIRKN